MSPDGRSRQRHEKPFGHGPGSAWSFSSFGPFLPPFLTLSLWTWPFWTLWNPLPSPWYACLPLSLRERHVPVQRFHPFRPKNKAPRRELRSVLLSECHYDTNIAQIPGDSKGWRD